MYDPDELITMVVEGEEPEDVAKKVLHDRINSRNVGGDSKDGYKIPKGTINNIVWLANEADAGKAQQLLDSKNLHYTINKDKGVGFCFDYNSARDGAAQLLSSHGIKLSSVA